MDPDGTMRSHTAAHVAKRALTERILNTRTPTPTAAPMLPPALAADPLLPPAQAAEYLGIKVGTLEVWRSTGRYGLPYVKVGRNVRYRQSALKAFAAARTVAA